MRKLLRRFLDWLDARFPEKVHITLEQVESIDRRLDSVYHSLSELESSHDENIKRFAKIEASISAIKDVLAKGGASVVKSESDKLRDQFIRGEFPRSGIDLEKINAA